MPKNYSDGDFLSSYVLNNSTIHKMTGTEIAALTSSETIPGYLVYCTTSGGGKTANNLYQMNEDNTAWEVVGLKSHTHTDGDSGGELSLASIANIPTSLTLNKRFARANAFWTVTASGGTVTDDEPNGRVLIQTSTTSGGRATISDGGARKLNFAQPSAFEVTCQVSSSTNFLVKLGIGAEDINAGNLSPPKYGIEGCSTSGSVWLLFSSNGTTRSTLTTSANVATGVPNVYRVEHTPGADVKLYIDGTLAATKTLDIPSSGTTGFNDVYRAGIKNSAAENKILYHYGVIVEGSL